MNRRQRTALTVLAVMCVVAAAACAGIWHYHDDMGRYLVRRAIANAAAAPQPPAATESDYPTLPLESALTHAPAQPLDAFPLTERTWGERFNPGGNLPDTGYAAWYFDSDDLTAAAVAENSAAIALNYEYNERYHTPAARLGAYWAGTLHVPEKGRYVFLPDVHQGRVRVLLDRHVLLADTAPGDLAAPVVVELEAGDYRLETEYLNFNWRAARFQLDILANPAIFDSTRLTALIAALKPAAQPEGIRAHLKNRIAALQLPANSENYAAALHGALGDENRAILHAPPGDAPYILWLAGEHAVNWHIEGRQPQLVIHNARSHVAADIPALIWTGAFSQHSGNARCHCDVPQGWRCDIDAAQNLTALAAEIQRISGQPLRGFAHDLRSSQLHLEPQFASNIDAIAAQQSLQQQQAERRKNCVAAEDPPHTTPAYDRDTPSLAAWPLVTDGWGAQLNLGDAVPAEGFAVWYRDRRAPQRTFTETTDRIYLDAPKYGIANEHLDAYWAGKIHVPEAGAYQPVSKTTPAELRILLNKHDISANGGGGNRPLHLEAGDYLLEAEYRSHDEQAGLSLALVRRDDEPLGQGPGAGPLAGDGADGAQDRVAHGEGVDALADGVDDARVVAPDPLRGRRGVAAHHAGEDLPVHRVEARRPHRDPDPPGTRCGLGDLDHLQDLRAAEAPVLDRSHHDHASLVARLLWSPAVRPGAARRRRPAVMTSAQPPGRRTFTMISI